MKGYAFVEAFTQRHEWCVEAKSLGSLGWIHDGLPGRLKLRPNRPGRTFRTETPGDRGKPPDGAPERSMSRTASLGCNMLSLIGFGGEDAGARGLLDCVTG